MEVKRTIQAVGQGLLMLVLSSTVCAAPEASVDAFTRGWEAYQSGHYSGALQHWTPLADAGDAEAQLNIGYMYDAGHGVPMDPSRAVSWYRKSAEHGYAAAQFNLGMMYAAGRGVTQDSAQAQYWLAQAAGQGLQEARAMLPEVAEGVREAVPGSSVTGHDLFIDSLSGASTGTAWPVAGGYAITSNHVVAASETVTLYDLAGHKLRATVAVRDTVNDLAVLSVSDADSLPPPLPLSSAPVRLGSDVFTLGFPRVDILGRTPKLTDGIISSVNGFRDDPGSYQISVQIQPGNSGGPLLNMDGEVVGIVASMLGTVSDTAETVVIPNISYAVKVEVLQHLLQSLPERTGIQATAPGRPAPLADLAERIQPSVLLVVAID